MAMWAEQSGRMRACMLCVASLTPVIRMWKMLGVPSAHIEAILTHLLGSRRSKLNDLALRHLCNCGNILSHARLLQRCVGDLQRQGKSARFNLSERRVGASWAQDKCKLVRAEHPALPAKPAGRDRAH
eukprot:scaffold212996_cov37-Tisochrysis_lutea.AAC.2